MQQLTNFGSSTQQVAGDIDEANDTYPVPLAGGQLKTEGNTKLLFAIYYLQVGRLRELLTKPDGSYDIHFRDMYGSNILALVASPNFPSNISYQNNKHVYEDLIKMVLLTLKPLDLEIQFDNMLCLSESGNAMITNVIRYFGDRPHLLLLYWNFGLKYSVGDIDKYTFKPLIHLLLNTANLPFQPGKRWHNILGACPITLGPIAKPAILTDGRIYEFDAIEKYLGNSDASPISKELLVVKNLSSLRGELISAKTLYLPEFNRFVHIGLCKRIIDVRAMIEGNDVAIAVVEMYKTEKIRRIDGKIGIYGKGFVFNNRILDATNTFEEEEIPYNATFHLI